MRGKIRKEGKYELFETTRGHTILNLENENYYALVEGQQGEIIVKSDSDHKREKSIAEGEYYYVDFEDDPEFIDMPHLFLQDQNEYNELILPEGLPNSENYQKKLIRPDGRLSRDKVLQHVKGSGNRGKEKQYSERAEGLRTKKKDELYDLAQKYDIKDRSKMNKDELAKALEEKIK